jgi:hypothetical protein
MAVPPDGPVTLEALVARSLGPEPHGSFVGERNLPGLRPEGAPE